MRFRNHASSVVLAALLAMQAHPAWAQTTADPASATAEPDGSQNADIVVTAQGRETNLQDTSIAISAFGGESLEAERVLSFEDLAGRATSLSFTALSPLDQEFNIRGITNTRLDSPSADQSIGIFVDRVYVGRSGLFNFDLYDIGRVEVVRGPQGVLLGRNVVGGAISIFTARPEMEPSGNTTLSVGSYDEILARGHVTGALGNDVAGRFSYQSRRRDGFNKDVLNGRDLDNIQSIQLRGQLAYMPEGSDFRARLIFDYTNDEAGGFHTVAFEGPSPARSPWALARDAVGVKRGRPLGVRESLPEDPLYKGDTQPTRQGLDREAWGLTLDISKGVGDIATFESVTGFRHGEAFNLYSQTGIGPDNGAFTSATLFDFPVNETEKISQFTQEVRLVSNTPEVGLDWIVGAYYQHDKVDKFDRFWAEIPVPPALLTSPAGAGLRTLSGESTWDNAATNTSYAAFAQLGYRFADWVRVVGGVRYTRDQKKGDVTGTAVETGDKFNPNDPVALTPLAATFTEGQSFTTPYSDSWSEITPQVTVEITPSRDLFLYATYSTGYKGGGFEDDPANAAAARASYDPETVTNWEIGAKIDFLDRRARLNVALFSLDYKNLQVTQTSQACLCNITDNAADAKIKGVEVEAQLKIFDALTLFGGATYLDTKYIDFVDSLGNDNSGNFLQRTPKYQFNAGGDLTFDIGDMRDAVSLHVNYNHQGRLFWAPDNLNREGAYGVLDARLAFSPDDGRTTLSVFGKNISNTLYRTNIIPFFGDEQSRLGAPRTYGIEANFRL